MTHGCAGFAFIDVTTAAFSATSWRSSEMAEQFPKELGRCSPREILLPQSLRQNKVIQDSLAQYPAMSISYYPDWDFNAELSYKKLREQELSEKQERAKAADSEKNSAESAAVEKRKRSFKEQKEFEAIEQEILVLEEKKSELEEKMSSGEKVDFEAINREYAEVNGLLENKYERWEQLASLG